MFLPDVQASLLRVGELQTIAQQSVYQSELAQKALAQKIQREARDRAAQVQAMESGAVAAEVRPQVQRQAAQTPRRPSSGPGQHIDRMG